MFSECLQEARGLRRASQKTVMTRIAFPNWRHRKKRKKNPTTIAAVRRFLTPQKRKEIYCHCSQLVNVLNHCCILCQLWFTAPLSVPALRGANFPKKNNNGNARGWRRVSRRWHRQIWKRREKKRREERDCGSQTWAPTLFSPPRTLSHYSSRYYPPSLACVSAALSDATLQSESAIATSRACSVSRALTLASSAFRRGVVVAAVRGGGAGESISQGGEGLLGPHFKKCSFQTVCATLRITWKKTFCSRDLTTGCLLHQNCRARQQEPLQGLNILPERQRGGQSFFLYLNQRINDNEVAGSCTHDTVWNIFN